jgi:hypothetical protein
MRGGRRCVPSAVARYANVCRDEESQGPEGNEIRRSEMDSVAFARVSVKLLVSVSGVA